MVFSLTVNYLDGTRDGGAKRVTTFFIAAFLKLYILAIIGTAMIRLPHIMYLVPDGRGN